MGRSDLLPGLEFTQHLLSSAPFLSEPCVNLSLTHCLVFPRYAYGGYLDCVLPRIGPWSSILNLVLER